MPKKKTKFYAVAKGKTPGIYETWDDCKKQVDGFKGAIYKSFTTKDEAIKFNKENAPKEKRPNDDAAVEPTTTIAKKKRRTIEYEKSLTMTLNFDGGSRGNGKRRSPVAGAGAFLRITSLSKTNNGTFVQDKREEYRIREFCQNANATMSNNYAEYTGLIVGLKRAKKYLDDFGPTLRNCKIRLTVLGDSQLVIKQTVGEYKCQAENIRPLYKEATELVAGIRRLACDDDPEEVVTLEHVYRKDNTDADELANEAMNEKRSWITHSTVSGKGTLFAKTKDLSAEEDNE